MFIYIIFRLDSAVVMCIFKCEQISNVKASSG